MPGVSVGFFTPSLIVRDHGAFATTVLDSAGIVDRAFPKTTRKLKDGQGRISAILETVSGPLPLHTERPDGEVEESAHFHFVMATKNRPALLTAAAEQKTSETILNPDAKSTWGMGCLELRAGLMVHFDPTRYWQAIVGMPLGSIREEPRAIILRVPWKDAAAIQYALSRATDALRMDPVLRELLV